MENLERLYRIKKELDRQLEAVKNEQTILEKAIKDKRESKWNIMFDDLYKLSKYSRYIDTGIKLYNNDSETLGFEVREEFICVISWKHSYGKSKTDTYFFAIERDKPFYTNSHYKDWMKYVLKAVENWNDVLVEIEKRLAIKMKNDMVIKLDKTEKKQIELESQLRAIL